jgi:protein gp37
VSEGTAIEWADDSWNPFRARKKDPGAKPGHFCVPVSPGCKRCYAEELQTWPIGSNIRYAAQELENVELFVDERALEQPLRKKKPRDIFPCSMTDMFAAFYPDDWIARMFDVMYRARQHRYLILTKRAERMFNFVVGKHGAGNNADFFRNIWFGISAEDQELWDERAPYVDEMRALGFNTWASCEPLLSDINIGPYRVHRIIIGGESGNKARPTVIGHIRGLLRCCQFAGISPFVKQIGRFPVNREGVPHPVKHKKGGDPAEWPEDLRVREPWPVLANA